MAIFQRSLKLLLILFALFISSILVTYLSLLYKPESIFFIANKTVAKNYSFEYSKVSSKVSFLRPVISIDNILIKDQDKNVVLNGNEILIGIDLLKSFSLGFIHLTDLKIDNFNFLQDSSSNQNTNFKILIQNLNINSNNNKFKSFNSRILSQSGKLSIATEYGEFNNINFNKLNIFNKLNDTKYYYSVYFNLDEQILNENEFIDFSSFSEYKLNLTVYSSGYFASDSDLFVTNNRYSFKDSKLKTKTGYLFENINAVLYENSKKEITGIFEARIPDQNISGSIQINNNNITMYTNLEFNMNEILNYENFNLKYVFHLHLFINLEILL